MKYSYSLSSLYALSLLLSGCATTKDGGPNVVEFANVPLVQQHKDWQDTIYKAKASAEAKTGLEARGVTIINLERGDFQTRSNTYGSVGAVTGPNGTPICGQTMGNELRQIIALYYGAEGQIHFGFAEHEWAEAIALAHGLGNAHSAFKGKGIFSIP